MSEDYQRVASSMKEIIGELRRTLGKMELALGAIGEGIVFTDEVRRVTWCNTSFAAMVGRAPLAILGRDLVDVLPLGLDGERLGPDRHPSWLVLSEGSDHGVGVYESLSENRVRSLRVRAEITLSSAGARQAVLVFRDVTDEQRRAGAERLTMLGELLAGVTHEIKTPLSYVKLNVDHVRSVLATEEKSSGCGALDGAIDAIEDTLVGLEQIENVVRSVGWMAHPEPAMPDRCCVNAVLDAAIDLARAEWRYRAELQRSIPNDLPLVHGVRSALTQVFINLVVNAAHAFEGADVEAPRITVEASARYGWLEIRVIDNGPGVPAELRDQIFHAFFTTKKKGKGTGQGLYIARTIITEQHGGRLTFEPTPGGGATFVVRLRLASEATEASDEAPQKLGTRGLRS